ncbi:MAG: Npt1/Npt2 family nucleotide transporter [Polyangiaceae bacterium]
MSRRFSELPADPSRVRLLGVWMTRGERERSGLLFLLLALAAMVLVVGRAARDALFLMHFPVTWVAPMWMAYAITSSVISVAFTRALARWSRSRFAVIFGVAAAASYAVVRALIARDFSAAYAFFYIWSEVIANLVAVLAWTIAQDYHDARSAKRLFGIIGAGRVVGIVVSGFATGALVRWIGTANLIVLLAAALALFGGVARFLSRRHPLPTREGGSVEREIEDTVERAPLRRSRYVVTLSIATLLTFAVLTIADYQFKAITRSAYPHVDDLAQFMGLFYGAVGLLGLFVQIVLTPNVLRRFGVLGGLAVMPVAVVASTIALALAPGVVFAAALKASDNGLQFSIYEATHQLLFFPFSALRRERVRLFVGAVVKPAGYALAAVVLVLLAPRVDPGPGLISAAAKLSWASLPLAIVTLLLLPRVRDGYIEAMRRTLTRREAEQGTTRADSNLRALLIEAIRGADGPQVLFAMGELKELDAEAVASALPELGDHVEAPVRKRALEYLVELDHPDAEKIARAKLDDEDPEVRVTAVTALAQVLREDAHDELLGLAARGDDSVRTAAIAALLRFCGLDGMLDGAPRLSALLASPAPSDRASAARVLGMVGQAQLQRALARLLDDPDPDVRRSALSAARSVADVRLLPLLCRALGERGIRAAATKAIAPLGDAAVPALAARLRDPKEPMTVRLAIPRVLFVIGGPRALTVLTARVAEPNVRLRQKVLASASRLRAVLRADPLPHALIRARIDEEVRVHATLRDRYLAVRPAIASSLLDEHTCQRLRKDIVRILRLCELSYPREAVASVRVHLFGKDPVLRANAFEVLDALVDRELSARLADLVGRYLALRGGHFPDRPRPEDALVTAWIEEELASGEACSAALSFDAAARANLRGVGPLALAALKDEDPFVREAAAITVAVTRPAGFFNALRALADDPDPVVRTYAITWAETGRTGLGPEDPMYTTVEKVLFLQRVPVFASVPGEDLVTLARSAVVMTLHEGDVIFREGEPGGAMYLVISGAIRLTVRGREVAELMPNDVFGEQSIFDQEPRATTATVVHPTELLRVSAEDFHEAVRETVEIAEAVIRVLNRRLRETDRRLAEARSRVSDRPQGMSPTQGDITKKRAEEEPHAGWNEGVE